MVNNQMSEISTNADYDYIYNVIDYNYIVSINGDFDYLRSCNQLQSITDYHFPLP